MKSGVKVQRIYQRSAQEMISALRPSIRDMERAQRVIEEWLTPCEIALITRLVLEDESLAVVSRSLEITPKEARTFINQGLSDLHKHGRGVLVLIGLVCKGRDMEELWQAEEDAAKMGDGEIAIAA